MSKEDQICSIYHFTHITFFSNPPFPLQVGALIGAGLSRGLVEKGWSKEAASFVNLKLFGGIALSWVATIPFSMGLTALIYLVLEAILL